MRVAPRIRPHSAPVRVYGTAEALTAAGDLTTSAGSVAAGQGMSGAGQGRQAWQTEGWNHYDAFGELHYGAQFTGSCFSRVLLRLGWRNDANEVGPIFDQDGNIDPDCPVAEADIRVAAALLGAFRDPLGGTASLMEAIGKNLTITGDLHLVARDFHNDRQQIVARRWEVFSTDELRRRPNVRRSKETGLPLEAEFDRVRPGMPNEEIPIDAFVLRIYRRHPRYSNVADSAVRPLLDIMETVELITRQLRSTVLSRLAGAGLLWVPNEIDFPDDPTAPEGSEEDDPFARTLIRQMMAPITDRSGPSSVVPLVVRADGDMIALVKHMRFDVGDDQMALEKMSALIQRFAQGMDLPVEVTVGHQSTTFANAVQIDESTYKAHLEPLVGVVCGFLTAGYLWASMGILRPVDAPADDPMVFPAVDDRQLTRLVIIGDPSSLVTHENREKNAIELGVKARPPLISNSATRRALGFSDADAPDEDELAEWIEITQKIAVKETIRDNSPADAQALQDPTITVPNGNGSKPDAEQVPAGAGV